MKRVFTGLFMMSVLITGFQPSRLQPSSGKQFQVDDDTLIWRTAENFTSLFNKGDTAAINRLLPDDFMLDWLHQNFLGKRSLLNAMADTAVHATFRHLLNRDAQTAISYSDDHTAASLDATIMFLDPGMTRAVKKDNSYGLCIMYFQKKNGSWCLKTVHLDIHCTYCSI